MSKFFAGILLFFFSIILLFILLGSVIKATILSPDFYNQTLKKSQFFSKILSLDLIDLARKTYMGNVQDESAQRALTLFAPAMQKSVSEKYLEETSSKIFDNLLNFITKENSSLDLTIDLKEIKGNFINNTGNAILEYYKSLPICTDAQALKILNSNAEPNCQIKEIAPEKFVDQYRIPLSEQIQAGFPEKVDILELGDTEGGTVTPQEIKQQNLEGLENFRKAYKIFKQVLGIVTVIVIILLVLVVAILFKSLKSLFRFIGNGLFWPMLLPTLIATLIMFYSPHNIQNILEQTDTILRALDPVLAAPIIDLILTTVKEFASKLLFFSLPILIVGIVLFASSFFLPTHSSTKIPEPVKGVKGS
ncbi:MAG: hypothetical protein A2Y57_03240 [Candidatus Woykebacteria bacterium RBG_13_40_7b]|uniref:Uncharacterized protein n=1 Tax=Candidatus Woykebacteria bacterium RBG_13_40_7b TaxID=1802594 RepID=A0A1G1W6A6_9BACT|nr:MAG: hypothetical protein A2Y57_03240 [Candidatus Woykebacteria bacterium RBG_13_40_7b]